MLNHAAAMNRPAFVSRLLKRIQHEAGIRRPAGAPADDPPGVGIDDKGDIDEPRRGRDIGEVRYPKHVPRWRVEPAVDVIGRARCRLVADGRTHRLASDHACQAHLAHQPFNRTAGDLKAFPHHLPPKPAHTEYREVHGAYAGALGLKRQVPLSSTRSATWNQ